MKPVMKPAGSVPKVRETLSCVKTFRVSRWRLGGHPALFGISLPVVLVGQRLPTSPMTWHTICTHVSAEASIYAGSAGVPLIRGSVDTDQLESANLLPSIPTCLWLNGLT
jgi:hypothetical protein